MAVGLPEINHLKQLCDGCLVAKQARILFPPQGSYRAEHPLQLVHADICGPITPQTCAGNKYFLLLVDDFSRMMWVYVIKAKNEAFATFKSFKALVENQTEHKLKILRTDRGGEFRSHEFVEFCEK